MTYSGHVVVGGPAQVRELPTLIISKIAVGPYNNNCYLLRCRATGEQVLIDAADDAPRLLELVGPDGLTTVITTHGHSDHWQALEAVVAATGARTVAHSLDAVDIPTPTNTFIDDGEFVRVGDCTLLVTHLIGHTAGSINLTYDDPIGHAHLFSGDCLFPGGIGRTQSSADFTSLYEGVVGSLFEVLPDETWVYPGHGNDTTLGAERPHLGEWLARAW